MKKYKFTNKLLSSLVHTEDTNSNMANIFREKILKDKEILEVPAVHGNSIRGLLRDLGAKHLLQQLETQPNSLKTNVFHILFSGGALEKSDTTIDIEKKKELREMLPFLSIFGSAIGNEMIQGKLIISSAYPKCLELETGSMSYNDMVSIIRYTRQDDTKKITGEKYTKNTEEKQQMFYDIEVLNLGVELNWEIILDSDNEIEISCLETILKELENKPYLGGASRVGHGKIDFNIDSNMKPYLDFLKKNKNEITKFLQTRFT